MKRSRLSRAMATAVALGAGLALSTAAFAHGPRGGACHGKPGIHRFERKIDQLGLDAQTQQSIHTLIDQAKQNGQANHDKIRAARQQLRDLLAQDNPDLNAVLAQADAIGALQTQAKKDRLTTLVSVRKLLTADQWQQLLQHGGHGHHRTPTP